MLTKLQYRVRSEQAQPVPSVQRQKLLPLDYLAPRSWDTVCLVFSVKDTKTALARLRTGLALALADFQWLAGSIEADDGSLSLVVQPQDSLTLNVSHVEDSISYSGLLSAGFPQDSFDPSVLMPPGDWSITAGDPQPGAEGAVRVAAIQANIIKKGLILSLTWHQSCCDSTSMFSFVRRWAQCARLCGTKSVPAHRQSESQRLEPRPKAHVQNDSRMEQISAMMMERKYVRAETRPASTWNPGVYSAIIHLPRDNCASLLEKCAPSVTGSASAPSRILLHHAVLALVYKRVIEARWRTFHAGPSALSDISLALDLRCSPPYINIGFGNTVLNATSEPMAVRDILSDASLPRIAEAIRKTGNLATLSTVNSANEWIERMPRPVEATLKLDSAVSLNFAAVDYRAWRLDELDFGFQPPKAFRHGNPPRNGMAMLLPAREGAGMEVLVALEQSSMRRLLDDWELRMYATVVLDGTSEHPLARSFVGNDRGEGR